MTDFALDDELVQDYLAESREYLAAIENDLLAIESAGADIDEQLVNNVFRAAHSIKGGAGFFDLTRIRELAHRTENVLDLVRSRQLVPTHQLVSVLFLAFDKLREMIDNHRESNEADIAGFLSALTDAAAGLPGAGDFSQPAELPLTTADAAVLGRASEFDVEQARRAGNSIFIVACDLLHDVERKGRTVLTLFKAMMRCGTVLDTGFDAPGCGTLDDEVASRFVVDVLYATRLDLISISQVFEVPAPQIRLIEENRGVPAPHPVLLSAQTLAPAVTAKASSAKSAAAGAGSVPAAGPNVEATIRLNVGAAGLSDDAGRRTGARAQPAE